MDQLNDRQLAYTVGTIELAPMLAMPLGVGDIRLVKFRDFP